MIIFDEMQDLLHHAYLLVGDISISREKTHDFLQRLSIKTSGNPDVQNLKFDTLNILAARDLALSVEKKDFGSSKKIFIIESDIITEEAQNALLKVFEEPTPGTHFFILTPQDILLPTLRSRVLVIKLESQKVQKSKKFIEKSIADRLEIVKEITDGISDEEKTKQDAIVLLNQIESELYLQGVEKEYTSLLICEETRKALYDRGTPVKMVLENLVLTI